MPTTGRKRLLSVEISEMSSDGEISEVREVSEVSSDDGLLLMRHARGNS